MNNYRMNLYERWHDTESIVRNYNIFFLKQSTIERDQMDDCYIMWQ